MFLNMSIYLITFPQRMRFQARSCSQYIMGFSRNSVAEIPADITTSPVNKNAIKKVTLLPNSL
jgi:hypothetical protein